VRYLGTQKTDKVAENSSGPFLSVAAQRALPTVARFMGYPRIWVIFTLPEIRVDGKKFRGRYPPKDAYLVFTTQQWMID
jgi:hypothetical protein